MNSWIMRRWLETHKKEEYPDLPITQENDAFHVLPKSRHPPEESIERMCSPGFFSQHKYKYHEEPVDFELKESVEESGNPPESPPYDEQFRGHSQDCVAKVESSNEDLGYACLLNERMCSMGTENDTLNPLYEKTTNLSGTENQNLDYARQNAKMNETHHYAELVGIGYHSGMDHNKNGAHIEANGFKAKNNKREGSENEGCPSFSIHNEKQTGIPMETKYQSLTENRGNPVGLKEKGENQSYQSETQVQEQEGDEEEIYGPIYLNKNAILKKFNEERKNASVEDCVNTRYSSLTIHNKKPTGVSKETENQHLREHPKNQASETERNETQGTPPRKRIKLQPIYENNVCIPMNPKDEEENIRLGEICNQKQRVSQVENVTMAYLHEDGSGASTEDTPVTHTLSTEKSKEDDHGAQSPVPTGEGTECEVPHQPSPMNPEDEEENTRLGEICNQMQRVSQVENMRMAYLHEDGSGASTEDTPVTQTLGTEKSKEEDHGAQSPVPTGEGTECEVPYQPSPMNPEDEEKNTRLGEICNQKQRVSQVENMRMAYLHEDGSGASTEDTPVTQTLSTEKSKEDDHGAQSPVPTGEGTECEVPYQPSPMNPEDEEENTRLGEICNQKQRVSQVENMRMAYLHEDGSGASTEDTPVTQTLSTEKPKEEDHGAQSPVPTGEGTEGEVPHQPSPFRRTRTIWRKQKSPEAKKQRARKAKNLENKENAVPGCDSEKEVGREEVLKEVNEQDRTEEYPQ